jgi:hypothetical protein
MLEELIKNFIKKIYMYKVENRGINILYGAIAVEKIGYLVIFFIIIINFIISILQDNVFDLINCVIILLFVFLEGSSKFAIM